MKKNKIILLVALSLMSLTSCNDAIDIVQKGEVNNESTFKTVNDLESFLLGDVYSSVGITNEIQFTASFTDEVGIGSSNGGQQLETHRFFLNSGSGNPSSMWLGYYTVINRVNRLIDVSSLISMDPSEQARFDDIIAQAKVLRAFSYLQLEAYFSPDMSDPNALGVMLVEGVPTIDVNLPRVSNSEIFAQIEADLNDAEGKLINPAGIFRHKFVSTYMVDAIRARYYAYRKDYTNAKLYAQKVIDDFYAPLTPISTYPSIWQDAGDGKEIIFGLSRPIGGGGGNVGSLFVFNSSDINGAPFLKMGANLRAILEAVPGDVRATAFIDPTSTATEAIIDKYPGKLTEALKNDLKVFRLSEMYFILAEAEIAQGAMPFTAVSNLLGEVRASRITSPAAVTYTSVQDAWRDLLNERRKELCFEGHRYLDLKRLGSLANVSIDRSIEDDIIPGAELTLPITDHRFTFPIPNSEMIANSNMVQNPGYN